TSARRSTTSAPSRLVSRPTSSCGFWWRTSTNTGSSRSGSTSRSTDWRNGDGRALEILIPISPREFHVVARDDDCDRDGALGQRCDPLAAGPLAGTAPAPQL